MSQQHHLSGTGFQKKLFFEFIQLNFLFQSTSQKEEYWYTVKLGRKLAFDSIHFSIVYVIKSISSSGLVSRE